MFDEAQDTDNKTLPEIYAMGLRNPFTIGQAKSDGEVWFADYGPDATLADPTRGPAGHVSHDPHEASPPTMAGRIATSRASRTRDWDYVASVSAAATTTATTWSTTRRTT